MILTVVKVALGDLHSKASRPLLLPLSPVGGQGWTERQWERHTNPKCLLCKRPALQTQAQLRYQMALGKAQPKLLFPRIMRQENSFSLI